MSMSDKEIFIGLRRRRKLVHFTTQIAGRAAESSWMHLNYVGLSWHSSQEGAAAKDTTWHNEIAEAETATYEKYILCNCSAVEWLRYVHFIRLRLLSVYPSIPLCRYKLLFNSCATFLIWNGNSLVELHHFSCSSESIVELVFLHCLQPTSTAVEGTRQKKKTVPNSVHLYSRCDSQEPRCR